MVNGRAWLHYIHVNKVRYNTLRYSSPHNSEYFRSNWNAHNFFFAQPRIYAFSRQSPPPACFAAFDMPYPLTESQRLLAETLLRSKMWHVDVAEQVKCSVSHVKKEHKFKHVWNGCGSCSQKTRKASDCDMRNEAGILLLATLTNIVWKALHEVCYIMFPQLRTFLMI